MKKKGFELNFTRCDLYDISCSQSPRDSRTQQREIRVGLKLKLVSEAEEGWSWGECGQSEQERGCVW